MEIKKELNDKIRYPAKKKLTASDLSAEEKKIVHGINQKTRLLNKNNVTRTKGYLDFYKSFPEIHWAFLGHMVSRNGGWNMTDLKGELLSVLLTKKEQQSFFSFLERGNWLIFQDAYPQFLLYEESVRRKKSLFHLLSYFQISTFMETIWNHFLRYGDRYILTIALIINEQSYLEKRVIQNPFFKKEVLDTVEFKLQEFFSLTYILFPYRSVEKLRLAGQTIRHFDSLNERIKLGKRLYSLLFQNKDRLIQSLEWANSQPHTGSRQDYWPHIFHPIKEGLPGSGYKLRLISCRIRSGADRIYSPELEYAWKDVHHTPAESGDWFNDWKVIDYLINTIEKIDGEIEYDYCTALENLELAIVTKKTLSLLE